MVAQRGSLHHLLGRFVWSLRRDEPDRDDEEWLLGKCSAREAQLYHVSSRQDRRHAIDCGRRAQALLADQTEADQVIVAAALHDVGKTPARLSTLGRVAATMMAPFVTERRDFAAPGSLWERFGVYKAHPQIGAELLAAAGSDPLVVEWAAQHHLPSSQRTIDPAVGAILDRAD